MERYEVTPKFKSSRAKAHYDEYNDIRRNLPKMTKRDMERYVKGVPLGEIMGERFVRQKIKRH
jgi:hypothetical protein